VKVSVSQGVSDRAVKDGDFEAWVNKEAAPLLRQARKALNAKYVERVTLTTSGTGSAETLWTSDSMPEDSMLTLVVEVVAFSPSGPEAYGLGQEATFYRAGAADPLQIGSPTSLWDKDTGGPGVTLSFAITAADDTVSVRFADDGTVMNVVAHVSRLEVLP